VISNAVVRRIDRKVGSNAEGKPQHIVGASISIPCLLAPYSETKWQLGATVKDCSETIFIMDDDFAAASFALSFQRPETGDRIIARFEDEPDLDACVMEIVLARPNKLNSISHLELFLKKV